jgi:hypothetical protein
LVRHLENTELLSDVARCCLDVCQFALDSPTASTGEHTDDTSRRHEFAQQFKPLGDERFGELNEPCCISTRPIEACDQTEPNRVTSSRKDNRYGRGRSFGGDRSWRAAYGN